jgi:hypothetical protein
MKRNLIAIATAALALGANVALAQDQFADPYWKQLNGVQSAEPAQSTSGGESHGNFDFVDRYPAQ